MGIVVVTVSLGVFSWCLRVASHSCVFALKCETLCVFMFFCVCFFLLGCVCVFFCFFFCLCVCVFFGVWKIRLVKEDLLSLHDA